MQMAPPGWYPDPDDAAHVRFFDGYQWAPKRPPAPPFPNTFTPPVVPAHSPAAASAVTPTELPVLSVLPSTPPDTERPQSVPPAVPADSHAPAVTASEAPTDFYATPSGPCADHNTQPSQPWMDPAQANTPIANAYYQQPVQAYPSEAENSGTETAEKWLNVASRVLSFRIALSAAFMGFCFFILVGLILPIAAAPAMLIVTIVAWLIMVFGMADEPLKCPYCAKRVKIGAKACHHCGRIVAE